jgi:phosphoribosyl-dephospho-CoA transferase
MRHSWVWLAKDWTECLRGPASAEVLRLVEHWRALGRPFIVASPAPDDGEDDLRIGLALPDKRRIGVHIARRASVCSAPPPVLRDVVASAPRAWQSRLQDVNAGALAVGLPLAFYGSLAWEYWSGTAYVRANSDVDLLFDAEAAPRLGPVLDFTKALSADMGTPRFDGELILPGGAAVSWREFARQPNELLIKGAHGPALRHRQVIEGLFAGAAK